MDLEKLYKMENKNLEGYVEETIIGTGKGRKFIVEGNTVLEPVIGGSNKIVGYVREGVAYQIVLGGKPIAIGKVKYN